MKKKGGWRWFQVHLPDDKEFVIEGTLKEKEITIKWDVK